VNTRVLVSLVGSVVSVSSHVLVLMARPYPPAEPSFPDPPALSLRFVLSVAHTYGQYSPFARHEWLVVAPLGRAQPSVVPTA
jgi:hypothetical protein